MKPHRTRLSAALPGFAGDAASTADEGARSRELDTLDIVIDPWVVATLSAGTTSPSARTSLARTNERQKWARAR